MARTTRSVRVAAVVATTVCLLLLLLSATATTAAGPHLERGRDLLEESGGSPVALSKEEPPSGHLKYRIVKGIIEKATGKSARLDLEKHKEDAEKPLLDIP